MSVMGMVDNAQTLAEQEFSFPVSFERVYRDYWYKFANENELYWLKFFLYGIEVERASFDQVRMELKLFKSFLLEWEEVHYLYERKYIL